METLSFPWNNSSSTIFGCIFYPVLCGQHLHPSHVCQIDRKDRCCKQQSFANNRASMMFWMFCLGCGWSIITSLCGCRLGGRGCAQYADWLLTQAVLMWGRSILHTRVKANTHKTLTHPKTTKRALRLCSSAPGRMASAERQQRLQMCQIPEIFLWCQWMCFIFSLCLLYSHHELIRMMPVHTWGPCGKSCESDRTALQGKLQQLLPILFLHSSSSHTFDPLPVWILHHHNPLNFALSWLASQPAVFDTWWRK